MEKLIVEEIYKNCCFFEKIIVKIFAKIFVKVYHIGRLKCLNSRLKKMIIPNGVWRSLLRLV